MSLDTRVAIVGMSCVFPGARDLRAFRDNVFGGVDAITDVPPRRWEGLFYDPDSREVDRLYCRRGGFVDDLVEFDAVRWGVMPVAARSGEPDQLVALEVAARALEDAGYGRDGAGLPRESTGVILGRGGYMNRGLTRLAQRVRGCQELLENLLALLPELEEEDLARVRGEYVDQLGHHGPDTMIGLVPNLVASRIANRLDLGGPSYVIDAACASSLIAVDRACSDLITGRADAVLAGGVHMCQDVSFWSVFCQLGALSRSQTIRPFDRRADGILMGEGAGVVVLERLADAERRGHRIYAVIRGTGVSSDGRETSLMLPGRRGQERALARAWRMARLDPRAPGSVGLIEAHGTGTPAGDEAELETLAQVFGPSLGSRRAGLGSVKSMIGHAMPAAGVAGLIKAALAVHEGVLPPTLHCEEPHEAFERTRFRPIRELEEWEAEDGQPRRAGVNAFGFGGINAHVVLEQHAATERRRVRVALPAASNAARPAGEEAVLWMAAETPEELLSRLAGEPRSGGEGPCRLVVVGPDAEALDRAAKVVTRREPFRDRRGKVWFSPAGLLGRGGKLAFLYPGVDADFRPRIDDLVARFGGLHVEERDATELERTGFGIVVVNRYLSGLVERFGIRPDLVAGHSIGEWSAMIAAGVLDGDEVDAFLTELEPHSLEVPGVVFAAAGCGAEFVREVTAGLDGVYVAIDGCPHQAVLCGPEEQVDEALSRLFARRVLCQKLSFRSGFHSPHFGPYLDRIAADLDRLRLRPPRVPLWSATTCRPYPAEVPAIRELFLRHLVETVRFRELVEALWREGARVFVQAGTGSLVGLVDDTLGKAEHLAIAANVPRRTGLQQLVRLAAALWVEGAAFDHEELLGPAARRAPAGSPTNGRLRLELGAPLARVRTPLRLDRGVSAGELRIADLGEGAIARAFAEAAWALSRSSEDVAAAWRRAEGAAPSSRPQKPSPPPRGPKQWRRTLRLSLDTHPELLDHCFFRQPRDWPEPGDRFPVVPMTASLQTVMEVAREMAPDRVVVGVEKLRAYTWIAVERPLDIEVEATYDGSEWVDVELVGYLRARVRLADRYPDPPPARFGPCRGERPAPMTAEEIYRDRWMFHGPSYHGIVELSGVGEDGIRGVLENLPTPGALLDCAGQLMGLWIMLHSERDRMAMPVIVDEVRFFGPDPEPGERFDCQVWIRRSGARQVRADLELSREGRTWAFIEGWVDHRFQTDERLWEVMMHPEHRLLSEPLDGVPGGRSLSLELRDQAMADYWARRYLTNAEIAAMRARRGPAQRTWLYGRMAAKDAVRAWLWEQGAGPIFPIEIEILPDEAGRPVVRGPGCERLEVSIAHKPGRAVAMVRQEGPAGIDLERVEERDEGFVDLAFTAPERALLEGRDRAEWIARLWVAKEAVAKSLGAGLGGNPRRFEVVEIVAERLRVGDFWVATRREEDWIVGHVE